MTQPHRISSAIRFSVAAITASWFGLLGCSQSNSVAVEPSALDSATLSLDQSTDSSLLFNNRPSASFRILQRDILINADLWTNTPEILSAGFGFDGILGIPAPFNQVTVRAAGGTWNNVTCSDGTTEGRTSAASVAGIRYTFGFGSTYGDGLPVVFSWPVLPSTLDRTDFEIELNTGEVIVPDAASITPNFDYNERNTVVLVSPDIGNRLPVSDSNARFPVQVRVVADDTPLMLVGPAGPVSAVGLSRNNTGTPYESGPFLVGAKLTRMNAIGDGGPQLFAGATSPNDATTLYGDAAQYRLRILTSGGFSPDGVQAVRPNEFERYFQLEATLDDGSILLLTETNFLYTLDGYDLRIIGLAELGQPASMSAYDDCYDEDGDNQIDIVLAGDEEAMRRIRNVIIPASGAYSPFFNPGGPGMNPTPGVRYTAPGPADVEPVTIAIDDPMVVSYPQFLN
jgi:hypothetical protein